LGITILLLVQLVLCFWFFVWVAFVCTLFGLEMWIWLVLVGFVGGLRLKSQMMEAEEPAME